MLSTVYRIAARIPPFKSVLGELHHLRHELDSVRSRIDVDPELFDAFEADRQSAEYRSAYSRETPLVSICVGTFNRGRLLIDRCIASILRQDYRNFEVIVVGDCCTDDTMELLQAVGDDRIRSVNLPERGRYPEDPLRRWMVAGTVPVNHALELAKGEFITHLDDDDEYTPDRVGKLVRFIQETGADLVWHPFQREVRADKWKLNKAEEFVKGNVTTSSIFYHNWFRKIPWDIDAYKYSEPGDWNRLRKISYLGAKLARHPDCLLRHYKERSQAGR